MTAFPPATQRHPNPSLMSAKATGNVSAAIGYRGLGVDYSKDSFSVDTVSHGPVIGLEVVF